MKQRKTGIKRRLNKNYRNKNDEMQTTVQTILIIRG